VGRAIAGIERFAEGMQRFVGHGSSIAPRHRQAGRHEREQNQVEHCSLFAGEGGI